MSGPVRAQRAQIRLWRSLKKRQARQESGLFLAEGCHLTQEALRAGAAEALLCMEGKPMPCKGTVALDIPQYLLGERDFLSVCDVRTPQAVAAVCRLPVSPTLGALGSRMLALNGLQDPGNVGTILRTMDAAGFTGLLADAETADLFSPKALRATMGAVFRVPVLRVGELAKALKQLEGYDIVAGDMEGEPFFGRPVTDQPVCLVLGNEGAGVSVAVLALATRRVRLPMPGGAESLNVSVAAAVMMYDYVRLWEGGSARCAAQEGPR